MYTIIGLGSAGHNIVNKFMKYPQYNGYTIDCDIPSEGRNSRFIELPEFNNPEDYEKNVPDLSKRFNNIEDECLFVLCGASIISGAALRILEHLHKKSKINILYIKPDLGSLSEVRALQERACFNVLQEYSRSGVFENMYIVDNGMLEKIIDGAPIMGYYDFLNEVMVSTIHMINVFKNQKKTIGTFSKRNEISRLATFGILDPATGEENPFYNLGELKEKVYYYAIPEEDLKTDKKLLGSIKEQITEKPQAEDVKISYGVFPTNYEQKYAYFIARSAQIQK
jgi:hypothetical protein|tara:strand:+ start:470 stop:1315 length:846 start_codon:yes stop_codon:yes gene_type:complete